MLVVATAAALAQAGGKCPFELRPGLRLDGASHIGPQQSANSSTECCALCTSLTAKGCNAFEFLPNQGKCWLKAGVARTSSCGGECISGARVWPPSPPQPPPRPRRPPHTIATTLGVIGYGGGESSLVSLRGRLLLVDSPAWCFPWHMRFDNDSLAHSCVSYIRVVEMATGAVVANITDSCQHTFGAAFVHDDTLYIYATRCARYEQPHPWCERPSPNDQAPCDCWHGHDGNISNCAVDVFYSVDLQAWMSKPVFFPGSMLANVDVTAVTGRDDMKFLMIWEQGGLIYTNSPTPVDGWMRFEDDSIHGPRIGCPSIKFLPDQNIFYVVGGGVGVHAYCSSNLRNWSAAKYPVASCGKEYAKEDERVATYPGLFKWSPPVRFGVNFSAMVHNNTHGWDRDASDLDLVQWSRPDTGDPVTMLIFICGNQRTDGFGSMSVFEGSMAEFFGALWEYKYADSTIL